MRTTVLIRIQREAREVGGKSYPIGGRRGCGGTAELFEGTGEIGRFQRELGSPGRVRAERKCFG